MMLAATQPSAGATNPLRVVLATTHIPLRDVVAAVTRQAILDAADGDAHRTSRMVRHRRAAHRAVRAQSARRATADASVARTTKCLRPAAEEAGIAGPFPADTVFVRAMRGAFDAVIAPYHDVGMTAIKVASFGSAVNVTLGLPVSALLAGSRHGARHRGARESPTRRA